MGKNYIGMFIVMTTECSEAIGLVLFVLLRPCGFLLLGVFVFCPLLMFSLFIVFL